MIRRENECPAELREAMRGGAGSVTITKFVTAEELYGKGRLFGKITLNPGCGIGYHTHETDSEIFYIVKGTAIYSDNGEKKTVSAGDVLITPAGSGHAISNKSDDKVELVALIVYA